MENLLTNFGNNLNVVIVGAGNGGVGAALVSHLLGCDKVAYLHATARGSLPQTHPKLHSHVMDITDEAAIEAVAKAASEAAPIDIVIIATGLLHDAQGLAPEKSLRDITGENFAKIFAVNSTGPALVMKHFLPVLNRNSRSVFAALSARVGSISDNELGGWYAYRAAKAALNMLIKNASIEVGRRNKMAAIIGLHPGTVDTNLSEPFKANVAEGKLFTPAYSAEKLLEVVNTIDATQTGKCFAWDGEQIPA